MVSRSAAFRGRRAANDDSALHDSGAVEVGRADVQIMEGLF